MGDFIKKKAEQDKIFYIGYSQGTVQMFYALSHIEESYMEHNLHKFIALAPCSISSGLYDKDGKPDAAYYEAVNFKYHDMGIYDVAGPYWDENLKKGCDAFGKDWCDYAKQYVPGNGQPYSTQ